MEKEQELHAKALEAGQRAAMVSNGCGATLDVGGEHVFCTDPRLPDWVRLDDCSCQRDAEAAINAYLAARRSSSDEAEVVEPEPKMEGPPLYRCRCGSSALYVTDPKRDGFGRVQCCKCGMRTEGAEALFIAAEHWNRFASPPPSVATGGVTEDMVEAAARRICRDAGKDPDACAFGHGAAGENGSSFVCDVLNWEAYKGTANAVVSAVLSASGRAARREITDEMVNAGCRAILPIQEAQAFPDNRVLVRAALSAALAVGDEGMGADRG